MPTSHIYHSISMKTTLDIPDEVFRKAKVFLVNASQIFEKGNPKNFIPDDGIQRIADILIGWQEEQKLSRIVDHAELKKNDYNISPSRYIHTSDAETYRPIAEIVAEIVAELDAIEAEAKETDKALRKILKQGSHGCARIKHTC